MTPGLLVPALAAMAFAQGPSAEVLPPSPPEARRAAQDFGRCIADRSPELAAEMLTIDFTTRAYRSRLDRLLRSNATCLRPRGRMRTSRLLVAGAIAETLVERDGDPVNVRLARAATRAAIPARSPSDRVAICTVRSAPDEVGALFATEVASEAETAAARALEPVATLCSASGPVLETTPAGLRAMLATAAFRSVWNGEAGLPPQD